MSKDLKDKVEEYEKYENQIKELNDRITEVEVERDYAKDQMLKALADYQNLEKSMHTRNEMILNGLKRKVAQSIFDVIDDTGFAEKEADKLEIKEETKKWFEGIKDIIDKLRHALDHLGVQVIEVNTGEQFDSAIHEAIATVPQGDEGTVFDVIAFGYKLEDTIIRPAKVVVSKNS